MHGRAGRGRQGQQRGTDRPGGRAHKRAACTAYLEDGAHWQSSGDFLGSPAAGSQTPISDIVINEVLAHTDEPFVDAIELYNTTDQAIDITGWWLSDDADNFQKFRIPAGTVIAAHGYAVFYQGHWVRTTCEFDRSTSSAAAEGIWPELPTATRCSCWPGRRRRQVSRFGGLRRVRGDGQRRVRGPLAGRPGQWHCIPMRRARWARPTTPAATGPRVGPLVISEVMSLPSRIPPLTPRGAEIARLHLARPWSSWRSTIPTGSAVDLTNWHLAGDVDFAFAAGTSLGTQHDAVVILRSDRRHDARGLRAATATTSAPR